MEELLYKKEVFQLAGVCMEIFEAKAVEKLTDSHIKQVLNYLAASKLRTALLVNFGGDSLEWKRLFYRIRISLIHTNRLQGCPGLTEFVKIRAIRVSLSFPVIRVYDTGALSND